MAMANGFQLVPDGDKTTTKVTYLARQFGNGPDLTGRKKRDRLLSSRQAIRSAEALTVDAGLDLASQIQSSIEQELLTLVP